MKCNVPFVIPFTELFTTVVIELLTIPTETLVMLLLNYTCYDLNPSKARTPLPILTFK